MDHILDIVNDEQSDLAFEISEQIHALRHLYNAQRYRAFRDSEYSLSHMEGRVLYYVSRHPDATQSDLIAHLSRDKAQVARLIAVLKESGILTSRVDQNDRRIQRLALTEKGREVLTQVKKERMLVARRAVEGLDGEQQQQLTGMLHRIRANLEN